MLRSKATWSPFDILYDHLSNFVHICYCQRIWYFIYFFHISSVFFDGIRDRRPVIMRERLKLYLRQIWFLIINQIREFISDSVTCRRFWGFVIKDRHDSFCFNLSLPLRFLLRICPPATLRRLIIINRRSVVYFQSRNLISDLWKMQYKNLLFVSRPHLLEEINGNSIFSIVQIFFLDLSVSCKIVSSL